jgi:AcrR family transcriptional regulator
MKRPLPTKPSPNKKGLLKAPILDAASRLFVDRGFGSTSMQDIANEVGISKALLYYYFESKEDILASLADQMPVAARVASSAVVARGDMAPAQTLRALVAKHATLIIDGRQQFRVIDREEAHLPAPVFKNAQRAKRLLLDNFTTAIARGVEAGEFRPVDPRITALAIIGMCNWAAWWFKPDGRKSRDEVVQMLADLAICSVIREPSRRARAPSVTEALRLLREDVDYVERLASRR